MKNHIVYTALLPLAGLYACGGGETETKPNVLFVIADDQSYPYAGAYGCRTVSTPGFDRVARQGVLFTNAYVTSREQSLAGEHPDRVVPVADRGGRHACQFLSG